MSDKVKLKREVAGALEDLYNGYSAGANWMILAEVIRSEDEDRKMSHTAYIISRYAREAESNFDTLLQALVNGYEVEQTPEDKVRDYYNEIGTWTGDYDGSDIQEIIRKALDNLNIKIQGVNAE